jgi:predicted ATP-binding protein involved in virulence
MTVAQIPGFKLRYLKVQNIKTIDFIEIEFPPSIEKSDIFIMGNQNGLGKTSILESIALLFLTAVAGESSFKLESSSPHSTTQLLYDTLLQAGAEQATIEGIFEFDNEQIGLLLSIEKRGRLKINQTKQKLELLRELMPKSSPQQEVGRFFLSLTGLSCEPLILPPLMYFHSYRKIQECPLELGTMVKSTANDEWHNSRFKMEILRAMMGQEDLLENIEQNQAQQVLFQINQLVEKYAGGRIEKLRFKSDNRVEFRVSHKTSGASFSFDGLSSGQKEIISTLFLVWYYSQTQPALVLIDEPELHLDLQWHHEFIQQLIELAPHNQYIVATHANNILSTVAQERQILISR